jgi:hypothetical protein
LEPIAKLPYKFLPESKKPISDMIKNPAFKQDVIYQYEEEIDEEKVKKTLTIPYAEFADPTKPLSKLNSEEFLTAFFKEKDFKKKLS